MAYEVLARKWRPQRFEDVVGQEHVTATLANAIRTNRVAHGYLFVGPRGTGKTSVARIFAKALNCEKGPTPVPCGVCDSCREIAAGNSLDVLEIDGASNNGVDQVRDLRETVAYRPARGRFKIYIIDEVHMLSPAAFNALLKTLEEPPAHVKFLFATTEPQKILPTILSRCQRFDLRRIPQNLIVQRLKQVAEAEKVDIDEDALAAVARGAEGGLRDAESALDQLISFTGDRIREPDVLAVFGLVARAKLEELAGRILEGDVGGCMRIVAEFDAGGKDLQRLTVELLQHFRDVLVSLYAPAPRGDAGGGDAGRPAAPRAQAVGPERILRIADILIDAADRLRHALSKRTLLETALIRAARAASVVSIDELVDRVSRLEGAGALPEPASLPAEPARGASGPPGAAAPPPAAPAAPRGAVESATRGEVEAPAAGEGEDAAAGSCATARQAPAAGPGAPSGAETDRLKREWREFVADATTYAPLVKSCLADAGPLSVTQTHAVIGFDPEFRDEMQRASHPRCRKAMERSLSALFGRPMSVELRLIEERDDAPVTLPADSRPEAPSRPPAREPATAAAEPGAPQEGKGGRRSMRDWMKEPAVRETLNAFGGRIIDVREP